MTGVVSSESLRKIVAAACLVSVASSAGTAAAKGDGLELALRTGFGLPQGALYEDGDDPDVSTVVDLVLPVWFDAGYHLTPKLFIGAYFQYGFGATGASVEERCVIGQSNCSISVVRLGAEIQHHFQPTKKTDPWLGVGVGYEWVTWNLESGAGEGEYALHGPEVLDLQGGIDFALDETGVFALGPFLSIAFATYADVSCSGGTFDCGGKIDDRAVHTWLTLGIRGAYAP